jgi:hypothetical protein
VTKLLNFFNSAAQLNHTNGFTAIILDHSALRYGKKLEMNVKGKMKKKPLDELKLQKSCF